MGQGVCKRPVLAGVQTRRWRRQRRQKAICNRPAHLLPECPGQKAPTCRRPRLTRPGSAGLPPSSGLNGASGRWLSAQIASIAKGCSQPPQGRPRQRKEPRPAELTFLARCSASSVGLQIQIQQERRSCVQAVPAATGAPRSAGTSAPPLAATTLHLAPICEVVPIVFPRPHQTLMTELQGGKCHAGPST